jgi:hypothetical protein
MVHLPAVNTPQFDWARNKFDRKVAPVAPIFQPETVADAVLRAVSETPREYWLGHTTVKAIIAQMLVPSWADRFLAKSGKASETSNQPSDPDRPDNLFEAGRGDPGAHGRFDTRSSLRAFPFNPGLLRAGAACAAVIAAAAIATLLAAQIVNSRDISGLADGTNPNAAGFSETRMNPEKMIFRSDQVTNRTSPQRN